MQTTLRMSVPERMLPYLLAALVLLQTLTIMQLDGWIP